MKHEFQTHYPDPHCSGSIQSIDLTYIDVMKLVLFVRSMIDGRMTSKQLRKPSNCSILAAAKSYAHTKTSLIAVKVSTSLQEAQGMRCSTSRVLTEVFDGRKRRSPIQSLESLWLPHGMG